MFEAFFSKKTFLFFLMVFFFTVFSVAQPLRRWPDGLSPYQEGEVVVRWKDGAARKMPEGLSASVVSSYSGGVVRLRLTPAQSVDAVLENLRKDPQVIFAQRNVRYMALQCLPQDAYYDDDGQAWALRQIRAPQAWANFAMCPGDPPGAGAVTVAVLDTGIDKSHGDLAGRWVSGFDFVNQDADASDDNGHGTFVSGIIGASWDGNAPIAHCVPFSTAGGGFAGVAGDVRILPVKILDDRGFGDSAALIAGLDYAVTQGARVINLSLGSPVIEPGEKEALDRAIAAGVVVVAASGNQGGSVLFPAAYPPVVAVGATDASGSVAFYSNKGAQLDLVAPGGGAAFSQYLPGQNIFSTVLQCAATASAADYPRKTGDSFYGTALGTSFAAPFVTGAAALLFAWDASLTADQVVNRLISTADDIGTPGWDAASGYGRLNLERLIAGQTQTYSFLRTFNSPNPFYPQQDQTTNITLTLDAPAPVTLRIFDAAGEKVLEKTFAAGDLNQNPLHPQYKSFYVPWDGRNDAGNPVVSGVYFYEVQTPKGSGRNKIAVIRGRR